MAYEIGAAYDFADELCQPSRYKALYGGRGSAKSHFFAEAVVGLAAHAPGTRVLCIREVQKSLRESAKRLIEDKIQAAGAGHIFDIKHDEIGSPGGGVFTFTGMNAHNSESVKSFEGYNIAWVEEAQSLSERSLELLLPTIRAENSEVWFSWNPRDASDPVDKMFRGLNPPKNAIIRRVNFDENNFFPDTLREEMERDREQKPDRFAHIWLGEYEPQAVGAIWNLETIHRNRRGEAPTMGRILVAVDPAVSSESGSDEHGIVVGGIGEDRRGYLLDDVSMRGTPQQWAERAIATLDRYEADGIVIEVNQGGDMVAHTLRSVRPSVKIVEVRATRGKHVRAEPISALYSGNQISHVGTFPDLERQLCQMTAAGYEGNGSPDRCDALVWLFSELFPSIIKRPPPKKKNPPRRAVGWMGG